MKPPNILTFRPNHRETHTKPKSQKKPQSQKGKVITFEPRAPHGSYYADVRVPNRFLSRYNIFDMFVAPVCGDLLCGDGIKDGDFLLIRKASSKEKIRHGQIALVKTPYGLMVGHCYKNLRQHINLTGSNRQDVLFTSKDAKIQGVFLCVIPASDISV